ncbi:MAG: SDR family oxidoreductase [Gemmataceae bacterium]|nr:SDR family oxidoreductase [Gemmataceae bacterium]
MLTQGDNIMAEQLAGKTALVTGGSRGIGAAISKALGRDGATVLVNFAKSAEAARRIVAEIVAAGGKAHALGGDVSDPAAVLRLFEEIDKNHGGRIDVLVNNAGVAVNGRLAEFSDADYKKTMATNVDAVFYVTRAAAKRMVAGGRIITIGSILGERVMGPGMGAYAASKFAAAGLARGFAHELAQRVITSNLVQPGPIDTDMNPSDPAKNPVAEATRRMVPVGRYGNAEEVAAVVAFLASPAAAFVNGATINVDGGANA